MNDLITLESKTINTISLFLCSVEVCSLAKVRCAPWLAFDHSKICSFFCRNQSELLIGGVKEITVRVMVENKAPDAAYPGKVIVTYPSVIDYASSKVGPRKKSDLT